MFTQAVEELFLVRSENNNKWGGLFRSGPVSWGRIDQETKRLEEQVSVCNSLFGPLNVSLKYCCQTMLSQLVLWILMQQSSLVEIKLLQPLCHLLAIWTAILLSNRNRATFPIAFLFLPLFSGSLLCFLSLPLFVLTIFKTMRRQPRCYKHEFHETCHSVTSIVLVNSHQRWK